MLINDISVPEWVKPFWSVVTYDQHFS